MSDSLFDKCKGSRYSHSRLQSRFFDTIVDIEKKSISPTMGVSPNPLHDKGEGQQLGPRSTFEFRKKNLYHFLLSLIVVSANPILPSRQRHKVEKRFKIASTLAHIPLQRIQSWFAVSVPGQNSQPQLLRKY